ncbi:hypothetical protein Tco_1207172 [Tanacetum coccineum]
MDIPLDRIEVLRYDTKGVKVRKGIMQTKTELTLEQTQQGVSDEVLSDTKVFTMTMEILPEPTSNKLCDSILQAGNPLKEILLKLNLPDHRSVLTDLKIYIKKDVENDGHSSFQDKQKYEHASPKVTSSQEGKRSQDDDKRLDLADDLKEAQEHIRRYLEEFLVLVGLSHLNGGSADALVLDSFLFLPCFFNFGGSADALGSIIFPFGVVSAAATLRTAVTRLI